ncbi:MAG TPA: FHA domain-containing protein [Acidimicrobiales bacterium]|nr:FHA domain-containing protein [Acidimicrobiales bacterium]
MNCRRCGEILNANANFCWACGAPQHATSSPETVAVPVVHAPDTWHPEAWRGPGGEHGDELVIAAGPEAGSRIELTGDVTSVGRHEASDILLDDVSVSRHHAVFTRTASGRITLRDLNSLNGTYVNGRRVEETTLHSADEVQIGKFKLVFWEANS